MWKHINITKYLFYLYLCLCCEYGNSLRPAEKECQEIKQNFQPSMDNFIVGGTEVAPGELPYMVAIGHSVLDFLLFFCGGALVTPSCVLTAAHCAVRDIPFTFVVRAGVIDISNRTWNSETDYRVANITVHPMFDMKLKYNDIAIMYLETHIKLSANIQPICLKSSYDQPTESLTTAGWGMTSYNDNESKILLKAIVRAVPHNICLTSYSEYKDVLPNGITSELLCAKDPEGKQDGCKGDSGSPLMVAAEGGQSILVGITSFGRGCATRHPSVYTSVVHFLDFIEANTDMGHTGSR